MIRSYIPFLRFSAWLLLFCLGVGNVAAVTYYVSPTGSDTNDGLSLATPFLTIQRAADVATAGDVISIRGGVYRETVTPLHSGTAGNPIVFRSYNNETVTVSGADVVTGWVPHSGSIYKTTVPWDYMGGPGNTLFVDGRVIHEARWPNSADFLDRTTYATIDASTNGGSSTNWTLTDSALSTFPDDYWNGATIYAQCNNWSLQSATILDFDGTTGTVTHDPFFNIAEWYTPRAADIYMITGSLRTLDTADEWFKDGTTNELYVWIDGGGDPSSRTVEFRKREYAFDLNNRSYILIEDIDIRGAQINFANSSHNTVQGSVIVGADNFFAPGMNNVPERSGAKPGIFLEGRHNTIRDSEITDMFWSAIRLAGEHNRVINNYIHRPAVYNMNGNGILMGGTHQLISHNTIRSTPRSALSGQMPRSVIQYNEIHDTCRLTGDTASIYFPNSNMDNTHIHHNVVYDNQAHWGSGIYFDNFSSNTIVYNNVVYDNAHFGIQVNVPANFILVYNNTVFDKGSIYSWAPRGTKYEEDMYGTRYINNIQSAMNTRGSDVLRLGNFTTTSTTNFLNAAMGDFSLLSSSGAVDSGVEISGVTDGFVGGAPDAGAIEYGVTAWEAGHNFAVPPNPTYSLPIIQYQNFVSNNGFEYRDFTNWQVTGSPAVVKGNGWDYRGTGIVRTNVYSAELRSGDALEQTITGLQPDTTYVLSGFLRTAGGNIDAEDYDVASLTNGGVTTYRGSDAVGYMRDGDYLAFQNIDFGSTSARYDTIRVGINNTSSSGSVEVRIGSATGALLATLSLPPDYFGGWRFLEETVTTTTGVHDVYLVFRGTGNIGLIDNFQFLTSTPAEGAVLGVKHYLDGGVGDRSITVTAADFAVNENTVEFTTGPNATSAVVYVEKPVGQYVSYVDDIGLVEKYVDPNASDVTFDGFEAGLSTGCSPTVLRR